MVKIGNHKLFRIEINLSALLSGLIKNPFHRDQTLKQCGDIFGVPQNWILGESDEPFWMYLYFGLAECCFSIHNTRIVLDSAKCFFPNISHFTEWKNEYKGCGLFIYDDIFSNTQYLNDIKYILSNNNMEFISFNNPHNFPNAEKLTISRSNISLYYDLEENCLVDIVFFENNQCE